MPRKRRGASPWTIDAYARRSAAERWMSVSSFIAFRRRAPSGEAHLPGTIGSPIDGAAAKFVPIADMRETARLPNAVRVGDLMKGDEQMPQLEDPFRPAVVGGPRDAIPPLVGAKKDLPDLVEIPPYRMTGAKKDLPDLVEIPVPRATGAKNDLPDLVEIPVPRTMGAKKDLPDLVEIPLPRATGAKKDLPDLVEIPVPRTTGAEKKSPELVDIPDLGATGAEKRPPKLVEIPVPRATGAEKRPPKLVEIPVPHATGAEKKSPKLVDIPDLGATGAEKRPPKLVEIPVPRATGAGKDPPPPPLVDIAKLATPEADKKPPRLVAIPHSAPRKPKFVSSASCCCGAPLVSLSRCRRGNAAACCCGQPLKPLPSAPSPTGFTRFIEQASEYANRNPGQFSAPVAVVGTCNSALKGPFPEKDLFPIKATTPDELRKMLREHRGKPLALFRAGDGRKPSYYVTMGEDDEHIRLSRTKDMKEFRRVELFSHPTVANMMVFGIFAPFHET